MSKKIIKLSLDILRCPIFLSDIETGEIYTGIKVIDNDPIVKELNHKLGLTYTSYYEFESHNEPCWFNDEQAIKDKNMLLDLTKKLVDRLNLINDGSYEVIDDTTEYLMEILK